jgi:hypothetical protein
VPTLIIQFETGCSPESFALIGPAVKARAPSTRHQRTSLARNMKASNFATIRNDSDLFAQDKLFEKSFEEVAMKNASRYRALASLCRQQAAYKPDQSWHLLGHAERWEHLAEAELADHFKECNGDNCSNDSDKAKAA